jgi:hypothetical protein
LSIKPLRNPVLVVLVATSLFSLWATSRLDHRLLGDDALITLTYAKNLARGDGFVFNHPPPVLGTTTPLYALLVALFARVLPFVPLTAVAIYLSALCWAGVGWLLYGFRRHLELSDWQVATAALFVAAGGWVRFLGMEAYLFALLLVLVIGLHFSGRWLWAGLAAGLLFLTRGEGALVFGMLLVLGVANDYRRARSGRSEDTSSALVWLCVGFGLPVLLWSGYAALTFGEVFPNTLAAKIAQGASGLWQPFTVELLGGWLPAWGRTLGVPSIPFFNLWYAFVLTGFAVAGVSRRRLLVLPAWAIAYTVGYSLLGVPGYPWYALPVYFVGTLMAGIGAGTVAEFIAGRWPTRRGIGAVAAAAMILVVVVRLGQPTVQLALREEQPERHLAYMALAEWFRDHTDPGDGVAYHEIGYLAYYTDNRIVDLVGLVQPEVTPHVAGGDFSWGFWHFEPEYFVNLEGSQFLAAIRDDPRFRDSYRPVAGLPGFDDKWLTVYQKRDSNR